MSHTPPPYYIGDRNDDGWRGPPGEVAIIARVAKGQAIGPLKRTAAKDGVYCVAIVEPCGIDGDRYPELTRANAEFIVAACNAHDALLAACREAVENGRHDNKCGWWDRRYPKQGALIHHGGVCDCWLSRIEAAINLALSGVRP